MEERGGVSPQAASRFLLEVVGWSALQVAIAAGGRPEVSRGGQALPLASQARPGEQDGEQNVDGIHNRERNDPGNEKLKVPFAIEEV